MERYLRFPGGKAKAFTVSYDDGCIFDKRMVEIMRANGVKGTFNLNSGLMGGKNRLTQEECVELFKDSGMEVAVHGYKHLWPNALQGTQIYKEFLTDKENLEELFGGVVRGMAYSQGRYSEETKKVLKQIGIAYSRPTDSVEEFSPHFEWLFCRHAAPELKEFIKKITETDPDNQRNKKPLLLYVKGHSYEFNNDNNWDLFENLCETVSNREDIWYATNIELYDYAKSYENLQFSASGKFVKNDYAWDVYFRQGDKTVVAKAGAITRIEE